MLSIFIGLRHIKSHIVKYLISSVGLSLGIVVLTVSLAVSNGLDQNMIDGILSLSSHINISKKLDYIYDYDNLIDKLNQSFKYGKFYPVISELSLFEYKQYKSIGTSYGCGENFFDNLNIINGNRPKALNEGLIGDELRKTVGIDIGESILITTATGKKIKIKISGFFNTGYYDYDTSTLIIQLKTAQIIFDTGNSISKIEGKLDNIDKTDFTKENIIKTFPNFSVSTWKEKNSSLLSALKIEKRLAMSIFSLIIILSIFSTYVIISNLTKEKIRDIGILKAIGISPNKITKIFFFQGFFVLSIGVITGFLLSILLIEYLKENSFPLISDVYYIDKIPVKISETEIITILIFTTILAIISSFVPAYRASKLNPMEAINNE